MATVFSLLATGVSGAFAATLLRRYVARGRSNRALLYWGSALGMFCLASAALVGGVLAGWSGATFRIFYLFGAVLNVPWLAFGSVVANARSRPVTRWTGAIVLVTAGLLALGLRGDEALLWLPGVVLALLWGLLHLTTDEDGLHAGSMALLGIYSVVALFAVLSARLEGPLPTVGLPEGSELFPVLVRGFAVGGNAVGAVIVVLGAMVSVVHLGWGSADEGAQEEFRRTGRSAPVEAVAGLALRATRALRRARLAHLAAGNLMIALGVLIAAAGGAFSFLGETTGHAVGLGIGVTVMFLGFQRTTRRAAPSDRRQPDEPPVVTVYTRENCGLCRRAEQIVAAEAGAATVELVDIDEDPELQRRYNVRVPVVALDGVVVGEGIVEPGTVADALPRSEA